VWPTASFHDTVKSLKTAVREHKAFLTSPRIEHELTALRSGRLALIFLLASEFLIFIIYFVSCLSVSSRNSLVGIPTGYGLDDRGVEIRVPVGSKQNLTSTGDFFPGG
jgi:hypothetical protein